MRDHNEDDGTFTIDIDSFNNKGQKGDDDFETWLETEAPLVSSSPITAIDNSYTITGMASMGGYNPTTTTFTIKNDPHFAKTKQKQLPIDILHKWYPKEMKEKDDD